MSSLPPRQRQRAPRALEQCSAHAHGSPLLAGFAAFAAHALLCALLIALGRAAPSQAALSSAPLYEVELAPPPAAPEPPPAEPEPPPAEPPPQVKQPKIAPEPVRVPEPEPEPEPEPAPSVEPEPPAAAAAQAAEAETAPETATTTDTLVTGDAANHAGGTTERGATATHAVSAPSARALGVEGGTGSAAVNRTRPPQLASGSNWDCPLPEEALEEGVDQATVALVIDVAADGKVLGVEVKQDPGYGFGREARACAFKKRWLPGLNASGQPARGKLPVNVRFVAR
jgi:outer membrane biosynthesis protein TonB